MQSCSDISMLQKNSHSIAIEPDEGKNKIEKITPSPEKTMEIIKGVLSHFCESRQLHNSLKIYLENAESYIDSINFSEISVSEECLLLNIVVALKISELAKQIINGSDVTSKDYIAEIHSDYSSVGEKSVFLKAIFTRQWDLVRLMLEKSESANVNAAPTSGPNEGKSVLWYAAGEKQWDLVRLMLEKSESVNVNAAPTSGPNEGKSVLWCAAARQQWDLVRLMLEKGSSVNISVKPSGSRQSFLKLLFSSNSALKKTILAVISLRGYLEIDKSSEGLKFSKYSKLLKQSLKDYENILLNAWSGLSTELPYEICEKIFYETVFDKHPELKGISNQLIIDHISNLHYYNNLVHFEKAKNIVITLSVSGF
jgi:Ankyrin repeats (3 copies)